MSAEKGGHRIIELLISDINDPNPTALCRAIMNTATGHGHVETWTDLIRKCTLRFANEKKQAAAKIA